VSVLASPTGTSAPSPGGLGAALGRRASIYLAVSVALIVVTGFLGPSATEPSLPGRHRLLPPYFVVANPSPWLVSGLIFAFLLLGAWGVHVGLKAIEHGWRPNLRRLAPSAVIGAIAVALVPPMGSGDILMYAAYGRIAQHYNGDVYSLTPDEISRFTYDPVTSMVERPWQNTPSVYGPIATWAQQFASWIGADSVHLTVWILQAINAAAFVLAGLLVLKLAGPDAGARTRALLMVLANPVLIWALVAGAHNDAQAALFGLMALLALKKSPAAAGVLLGIAGAIKLSLGFYGLALLWALRGTKRGMGELVVGAAVSLVGLYLTTSRHAFDQILTASKFMSTGTPAKMLYAPLSWVFSDNVSRRILSAIVWLVLVVIVAMLMQVMPNVIARHEVTRAERAADRAAEAALRADAGHPVSLLTRLTGGAGYDGDAVQADALKAAVAVTFVWLVTALYSLPWYDIVTWMPLAGLVASRLDRLLLTRTTVMAIGYIPGRDSDLSPVLQFITDRFRDTVAPIVQTAIIVLLIRWCVQRGALGPRGMLRWLRDPQRRRRRGASTPAMASAGTSGSTIASPSTSPESLASIPSTPVSTSDQTPSRSDGQTS
jgi:alpha-1,6-mannosyltransferase